MELIVLNIEGSSNIFRIGDTLPDGEKVLALAPTAVQLGDPGVPRVIEMQQNFGGGDSRMLVAEGANTAGRGNSFSSMQPAASLSGLKPLSLLQDADILSQLRSLRQQLIQSRHPLPAPHPAKSSLKP
jgi:hypothetical protein